MRDWGRRGDVSAAAHLLQSASGGWTVVKLGPQGWLALGPDATDLVVPSPLVDVADTTGAGDAFNAALAHALGQDLSCQEALAMATELATMILSRPSSQRYAGGVTA